MRAELIPAKASNKIKAIQRYLYEVGYQFGSAERKAWFLAHHPECATDYDAVDTAHYSRASSLISLARRNNCWNNSRCEPNRMERANWALLQLDPRIAPEGEMIGVEIEFLQSRQQQYTRPNILGVSFTHDGSVQPNDLAGYFRGEDSEARIILRNGYWRRLYKLCEALVGMGCIVNKSCGLHVHLDMRHVDEHKARVMAHRLVSSLPFLLELVPQSRRENTYCKTDGLVGKNFCHSDRYRAVNFCAYYEHKTVEVRLHSGSLNPDKIRFWIELVRYISRYRTHIRSLDHFIDSNASTALKKWVIERHNKFNAVKGVEAERSE